ncbi:MmgE/PrpD family protein [Kerstersia gyiorum]|uniref:2-methylcitrate dehydratase n=1 Tax=Kerstersia gyiorum TaxID=206506 RepID=A0A171KRK3_9BURK|nr:MmgE/PrpD family protein [Kerstersia gyiorum]KKO71520.1 2-methylcitrate dehydratase [Kerstersia gyiorum]MCP1634786.1 2-methylcitrate dehydratase [Kerstersia gyiorum]MCP1680614.1 2-methylcitrate dehydratase [Kerstersia gyiorum]MCP1683949.1 2-methylcitrate dehydratase [Kerstersia gyiorum]MCP1713988.1 2-methylcitrate dehydratase [Kerstersia gyiorum]
MTEVAQLASFVHRARFEDISAAAVQELKIRILDTVGVAIGAQDAPPIQAIRSLLHDLGGNPAASYLGGGQGSADRVAFYNAALSRYLDYMDAYLAKGETNHPSDNLGAVLACAESADASGKDLLTALAVAYQVHTRLSDVAPVRAKGFDHTTQGAYAAAAASAKALGLDAGQIANAIAISGTANNALRVTRTGNLSHWKGLAYPNTAKEGVFAALLASRGITGPEAVFEGNKGFKDSIAGPFDIDWLAEDLESVRRTILKKHNAEIHSQSALDAALDIRARPGFDAHAISSVRLRTFDVAFSIIGGGEEGDKQNIRTKEEADHSLPYMLAAALLDGQVLPEQYEPERIAAADIQALLRKVHISPDPALSARFPQEMPAELEITFADGRIERATRNSYEGFHTQPMSWETARRKFDLLAAPFASADLRERLAGLIATLETHSARDLAGLLAQVPATRHTV